MKYQTRADWTNAAQKRVTLIGMSGLGKTYLSNLLRGSGNWYHYSVDYRIGTRYMGEHIVDNFKQEAMTNPYLRALLMSDSIYIGSNITFDNLAPLSAYLGKPGNSAKGGIPFAEYMRRQGQHRAAEIAATIDAGAFIERAERIYGYDHFVCDTSGSICEVVDPSDRADPVLTALAEQSLIVWIRGDASHIDTLEARFNRAPKPMFTRAEAMTRRWQAYLEETGLSEDTVDPDDFIRWSYRQILTDRLPLYSAIADGWGVAVDAARLATATSADAFCEVIADTLPVHA